MNYKLLNLVVASVVLGCSLNDKKDMIASETYPKDVLESNLTKQYDNAKWLFYASNFYNDTVWETSWSPKKEYAHKIVEFDLIALTIEKSDDTLDVYFGIKNIDTAKLYTIAASYRYCRIGITSTNMIPVYRLGCSQAGIRYSKPYPFKGGIFNKTDYPDTTITRLKSYDLYPLDEQEELFNKYLVSNQKYLCSWLKAEAIKRGIL